MSEQKPANAVSQETASGLKVDKKTIITVLVILAAVMVFAGVLTQVIPQGLYVRDANNQIVTEPAGEYPKYEEYTGGKLPLWKLLTAPIEVFASDNAMTGFAIILFITLIGGTFLVLDKSGVLKYLMSTIVKKYEHKKYKLLAVMVFAGMALSSVCGVLEESITLVPLMVAISLALGWDSLVGVSLSLVSIAFGYTAATFNPFNVGIVQSMCELPMFSGILFRVLFFAVVYVSFTGFLTLYAKRIEKNPQKSIVYETDRALHEKFGTEIDESMLNNPALKKATFTFVGCISGVIVCAIVSLILQSVEAIPEGIKEYIGYLPMVGMAILFTAGGLKAGSIAGIKGKKLLSGFGQGIKTIAPVAPMVIVIMAITYILQEGKIIDTILRYAYENLNGLNAYVSLLLIFALIMILEFFVGSGTAKAFLIMPLVIPLVDMIGITRQTLVLSFTMSDGFCNILYPTSGIMLIAIGLVNVSYGKFLRFIWKPLGIQFILSALFMYLAMAIGYK